MSTSFRLLPGNISKVLSNGRSSWSPRISVCAVPRPLQDGKKEYSGDAKKEEEREKTIEAMEAVKEGMVKVKETAEFVKGAASKTAKSVSSMSNKISKTVSNTTEAIAEKATNSIISDATSFLKDKVKDK